MEPEDIEAREFGTVLRGYDRQEVEDFAREVAEHVRRLQNDLDEVRAALESAKATPPPALLPPAPVKAPVTEAPKTDVYKQLGEETARILISAEQAGHQIKEQAKREAAEVLADARRDAGRIARQAREGKQQAEGDLRQLLQTRAMLAGQLEDVRRRLAEAVARLQAPLEPTDSPPHKQEEPPDVLPPLSEIAPAKTIVPADAIPVPLPREGDGANREKAAREIAGTRQAKASAPSESGRRPHATPEPQNTTIADGVSPVKDATVSEATEGPLSESSADSRSEGKPAAAEQPRWSKAPLDDPSLIRRPSTAFGPGLGRAEPQEIVATPESSSSSAGPAAAPGAPHVASPGVVNSKRRTQAEARSAGPSEKVDVSSDPGDPAGQMAEPRDSANLPGPAEASPQASLPNSPQQGQSPVRSGETGEKAMKPDAGPSADPVRKIREVPKEAKQKAGVGAGSNGNGRRSHQPRDIVEELLEEIREDSAKAGNGGAPAGAPAGSPSPVQEAGSPSSDEILPAEPRTLFENRTEALGEGPSEAARKLKRLFQEEHNDLLHRLRSRRGRGTLDDNMTSEQEQLDRFQGALQQVLGTAFLSGRRAGGGGGQGDPKGCLYSLVAKQVVLPLRSDLSRVVEAGLAAGDTPTSISERASDVFRVWKGVRTEMLGEGLVLAAFHQGLVDAWKDDASAAKRWVVSAEEQECPRAVCQANAAQGPVPVGSQFSSGHVSPPAHGGCTCGLERS